MPAVEPFEFLSQLSINIKNESPDLPDQVEIITSWSGIGFSILQHRLIVPLGEIVEMLTVPDVTKLPGVQPWEIFRSK